MVVSCGLPCDDSTNLSRCYENRHCPICFVFYSASFAVDGHSDHGGPVVTLVINMDGGSTESCHVLLFCPQDADHAFSAYFDYNFTASILKILRGQPEQLAGPQSICNQWAYRKPRSFVATTGNPSCSSCQLACRQSSSQVLEDKKQLRIDSSGAKRHPSK